ncbi:acyltransferase family protein [Pseudogemmobacter sp. W21_MBD1_M6]|uniref:acyltransferase family protein n=1 Tax=Pseudogemmobacter sp. W21_MBD1_M6 TaxID=3240271 RepID=UPI003F95A3AD
MTYRFDIQILRGIAVILVVLFHLDIPFFSSGFLGVDAFFVISGFLMALLYRQGQMGNFYRRRAARLLPAYFATIFFTLAISAFIALPAEHMQVAEQGLYASIFASNVGFWMQNSYFSKAEFNPLLHLWSLGVEIQFYLFVPFVVWLHLKMRLLLVLGALGSLAAALILLTISPKTAFFLTPFRIWQFLLGAGIAWYLTHAGTPRFARPWLGMAALIAVVALAMGYPVRGQMQDIVLGHPGLAALLISLATAGVLAFGLPGWAEFSLPGRVLGKLGDWSYSIYLAHFPVIVLALYQPFSGTILTPDSAGRTVLLVLGITLFSTLLYQMFERRRIWSGSFKGTTALICGAALCAMLSVPVALSGYNAQQLNILSAFQDRAPYRCGKLIRIVTPSAQLCELTGLPDSAPALALIGDSHADSVKASFVRIAQSRGYRMFFTVANAPVVAAPRMAQLIPELTALGVEGAIVHFSSASALRAFELGFDPTLQAAGIETIWLLDVPTFDNNVVAAIWDNPKVNTITPINFDAVAQLQIALRAEGIAHFDPRPLFCTEGCAVMYADKRPFYFDDDHLTLTGARQIEDMMRTIIDQFGS